MAATEAVLSCLMMTSAALDVPGWTFKGEVERTKIYNKPRPGSPAVEIKAVGMIGAPPKVVWAILRDYQGYKGENGMPYTAEAVVLDRERGDKVTYFYSIVGVMPFLYNYNIKIIDESSWNGGRGHFKTSWTLWEGPSARPSPWYATRLRVNDGHWQLDPTADETQTCATYWLFTAPRGIFPDAIANWANTEAAPKLFQKIRDKTKLPQYREPK